MNNSMLLFTLVFLVSILIIMELTKMHDLCLEIIVKLSGYVLKQWFLKNASRIPLLLCVKILFYGYVNSNGNNKD